jgi:hypothetical protein
VLYCFSKDGIVEVVDDYDEDGRFIPSIVVGDRVAC